MQTDATIVVPKQKDAPKQPPSDAGFFDTEGPSLPSLRHPEHFERYKETFLKDADVTRFSTRRNGEDEWYPVRGRKFVDGQVVKRWDRPLSSSEKDLDAHLGGLQDNGNLSWMWVFGGRYTSKYNVDVDNHEAKGKGDYDARGRWVQVADLSVSYLKLVKVAHEALARLDRPTVIVTSSRGLGLNVWQHTDQPYEAADVFEKMTAYLEDRHVNRHLNHLFPDPDGKWKQMEVFPMYGKEGTSNRLQRLPYGHGSVTLTSGVIIRPWNEQLDDFLNPGTMPSIERVIDHLLALYAEQFRAWLYSGRCPPQEEHEHRQKRLEEIEQWVKAGCPVDDPPARKPTEKPVTAASSTSSASVAISADASEPPPMPEWSSLPREQRVFYLATHGLPDKGSLNRSVYLLAVHLLGLELFGREDAQEVTLAVLERWCLTKHNGMSRRLDGLSLGPKVMKVIDWAIAKGEKAVLAEDWHRLRGKRYVRPLRVRWLICREGPVSLYSPSNAVGSSSVIYCVSDSLIHEPAALKVNKLPCTYLETIKKLAGRKPQKAVEFNVMFANYLDARGGKATINKENYMKLFLGYDNPNQWTRFKTIGEQAGVFRLAKAPLKGVRSSQYELLIALEDGETTDEIKFGGVAQPCPTPRPFTLLDNPKGTATRRAASFLRSPNPILMTARPPLAPRVARALPVSQETPVHRYRPGLLLHRH